MSTTVATAGVVRTEGLTKTYGSGEALVRALDGVTVAFGERELHRRHGARRAPASPR